MSDRRRCSVAVITRDSKSRNPSSNLETRVRISALPTCAVVQLYGSRMKDYGVVV